MTRSLKLLSLVCEGTYDYKKLKDRKVPLTPEEREKAMKAGAVWHPGNLNHPVCAIWKSSDSSGNTVYGCNTHRCMQVKPSLEGAINAFKFVKTTA